LTRSLPPLNLVPATTNHRCKPRKAVDPSSVEPTSLHTPAKEDVKHDTPGLTSNPAKMLHTDVDVALVNVTVTDPYNAW